MLVSDKSWRFRQIQYLPKVKLIIHCNTLSSRCFWRNPGCSSVNKAQLKYLWISWSRGFAGTTTAQTTAVWLCQSTDVIILNLCLCVVILNLCLCVVSMCPCRSWNQACSAAVVGAEVPGNSGLIKENPWNSSWSRFWITSSSGGVSTGGWRVKKRSKFSASRPHCWGGQGGAVNMGEGSVGKGRVGMERNEWIGVGKEERKTKQGEWWVEPGREMTSLEHRFKYQNTCQDLIQLSISLKGECTC